MKRLKRMECRAVGSRMTRKERGKRMEVGEGELDQCRRNIEDER